MNIDPKDLGALLERNRRLAGLTQTELAGRMGTHQPAISRAERGRATPTLDFLERWSRATGRRIELDFIPPGKRPARLMQVSKARGRGKTQFTSWERAEMARTKQDARIQA